MVFIFDFDGTLADSRECSLIATRKAYFDLDLTVPSDETITYYMGIPIEKSFQAMAAEPLNDTDLAELITLFRILYKEYEKEYIHVYDGIPEVLQILSNLDACYVASSKHSNALLRNLTLIGIRDYFSDVIGADMVREHKPNPESIFLLQQRHHFPLERAVMIGDATFDLQMGKAAGIKTCAVTWGSHSQESLLAEEPTYLINNVMDLLTLKTMND